MTDLNVDSSYYRPAIGKDLPLVVNRSHLMGEAPGFMFTISMIGRSTGDTINVYWDGELIESRVVAWYNYWMDFIVPPDVLQRHPGKIKVYYSVTPVGSTASDGDRFSPALELNAKFTLPGGEHLEPIQGAEGFVFGKDVQLTIPPWKNMEPGATVTVYWGMTPVVVDSSSIVVGQPVSVTIPWETVKKEPKGDVAVSYSIRDRVGNDSGRAPAVTIGVNAPSLLPMPTFAAVNSNGQLDLAQLRKLSSSTNSQGTVEIVVEYPGPVAGDTIVFGLRGVTADGVDIGPLLVSQVVGPDASDDSQTSPGSVPKTYSFLFGLDELSFFAGGSILAAYVVIRDDQVMESACRIRDVVGDRLVAPSPEVPQAVAGVLDITTIGPTLQVTTLTRSPWNDTQLTAVLTVSSSGSPPISFSMTKPLSDKGADDKLVWLISSDALLPAIGQVAQFRVSYRDDEGHSFSSLGASFPIFQSAKPIQWPAPSVVGSRDGELNLDSVSSSTVRVALACNELFKAGDSVTVLLQGKRYGPQVVTKDAEILIFDLPVNDIRTAAGQILTVSYEVMRGTSIVGPNPPVNISLRIAATTIGLLPAPVIKAAVNGVVPPEASGAGLPVSTPETADIKSGDTVTFEIRLEGGDWRPVNLRDGRVLSVNDLIPMLGASFELRYTVTRNGATKSSDIARFQLDAYAKGDARLPKPYIVEAVSKPGGAGNPYLDMRQPLGKNAHVVVLPWPFMRAGQLITIKVHGFVGVSAFPTSLTLTTNRVVTDAELGTGIRVDLPTDWLFTQPKVDATDIRIEVIIERPLASQAFRYMTLPEAIVNLTSLDQAGSGTCPPIDPGNPVNPGNPVGPTKPVDPTNPGNDSGPAAKNPMTALNVPEAVAGNYFWGGPAQSFVLDMLLLSKDATLVVLTWLNQRPGQVVKVTFSHVDSDSGRIDYLRLAAYTVTASDVGSDLRFGIPLAWIRRTRVEPGSTFFITVNIDGGAMIVNANVALKNLEKIPTGGTGDGTGTGNGGTGSGDPGDGSGTGGGRVQEFDLVNFKQVGFLTAWYGKDELRLYARPGSSFESMATIDWATFYKYGPELLGSEYAPYTRRAYGYGVTQDPFVYFSVEVEPGRLYAAYLYGDWSELSLVSTSFMAPVAFRAYGSAANAPNAPLGIANFRASQRHIVIGLQARRSSGLAASRRFRLAGINFAQVYPFRAGAGEVVPRPDRATTKMIGDGR